MMPSTEECIIVTGASGNLGSAVVRLPADRGAQVVGVDRGPRRPDMNGIDPDRVLGTKAAAIARFGRVTGLV